MSGEELKLLPCPFCGGADAFVEQADYSSSYVVCNDCAARGPTELQESDEEDEPGKDAAIRAWQKRPLSCGEERKFYSSEWSLPQLLEARYGGLVTDGGEAWRYRYSHKDAKGEYDLLYRPVAHPLPEQPQEGVTAGSIGEQAAAIRVALYRAVPNMPSYPAGIVEPVLEQFRLSSTAALEAECRSLRVAINMILAEHQENRSGAQYRMARIAKSATFLQEQEKQNG